MVGTAENPVQIDESYFLGRRKYGKGRLMKGNIDENNKNVSENESADWDSEKAPETFNIDDPTWCWVLGIYVSNLECKFSRLRDRSGSTLIPIIEKYVEPRSVIVTDLWDGYNLLSTRGFIHETVNHTENYVNPDTGYHTQRIERSWKNAKLPLRCEMQNRKLFQSHLNEVCWRMIHGDKLNQLLLAFLDDVKVFYG